MKKWWFGKEDNRDQEKLAARKKAKSDLRILMENDDKASYIAFIKSARPDITEEELERLIQLFDEQRAVHPSDSWKPS